MSVARSRDNRVGRRSGARSCSNDVAAVSVVQPGGRSRGGVAPERRRTRPATRVRARQAISGADIVASRRRYQVTLCTSVTLAFAIVPGSMS